MMLGIALRFGRGRLPAAIVISGMALAACQSGVAVESTVEPGGESTLTPVSTAVPIPPSGSTSTAEVPQLDPAGLTVAAVGDWYADEPDKDRHVRDAEQTRDAIIAAAPSLLLGLGDFSYEGSSPASFFEFIAPLEATIPVYPTYGNHDGIVEGELTRPAFYRDLRDHFPIHDEWYSFDVGSVHFISINSEYPEGSAEFDEQLEDIVADLERAHADDAVSLIIPFFHRAMVNPISPDGPDRTLQEFVHPVLDRYRAKIPLALQAHHHIYLRTHAVAYSDERDQDRCRDTSVAVLCESVPLVVDAGTGADPVVYGSDGIVFATVGTGGAYATGLTPDAPYIAVRLEPVSAVEADPAAGTFGYLHLTFDETAESIEGQYRANNGDVLDWFRVEKS